LLNLYGTHKYMANKVEDCLQDLRYSIIYIYIYTQKKVLVSGYKDPLHNYLSRKRKAKEEKNTLADHRVIIHGLFTLLYLWDGGGRSKVPFEIV
jgi:hypothetical protein